MKYNYSYITEGAANMGKLLTFKQLVEKCALFGLAIAFELVVDCKNCKTKSCLK